MAKRDAIKAPALERSPSHLLHGALQLALDIYGEEVGADGLTQRQFAVLSAVGAREGLTQTDLVRATGVDRSTLADMITRLTRRGYLTRERSSEDARANAVALTDEGRAAVTEAAPRVAAADARILSGLSAGKRDGFINQLRRLARDGRPELGDDGAGGGKGRKKDKVAKAEKKLRKKARKAAAIVQPDPQEAEREETPPQAEPAT